MWRKSYRADPAARPLADKHYNRQNPDAPNFTPPGRCLVLLAGMPPHALWVTSYPYAKYVMHRWAGAWVCSCFRREGGERASTMIREAVAATRAHYGTPPDLGMITFIDKRHVRPIMVRGKPVWGWTWLKAGFEPDGETKGGLLAFRLPPDSMPEPVRARGGWQPDLFGEVLDHPG